MIKNVPKMSLFNIFSIHRVCSLPSDCPTHLGQVSELIKRAFLRDLKIKCELLVAKASVHFLHQPPLRHKNCCTDSAVCIRKRLTLVNIVLIMAHYQGHGRNESPHK